MSSHITGGDGNASKLYVIFIVDFSSRGKLFALFLDFYKASFRKQLQSFEPLPLASKIWLLLTTKFQENCPRCHQYLLCFFSWISNCSTLFKHPIHHFDQSFLNQELLLKISVFLSCGMKYKKCLLLIVTFVFYEVK